MEINFSKRTSVKEVEEGKILQPKFDENGLIPVITIDNEDNQVLMHGYMNEEAFKKSIKTKMSHFWSRSRKKIWKKGETSGFFQNIVKIQIDDDQDCIIIFVTLSGTKASCHVGYKSCFYRELEKKDEEFSTNLVFNEDKKVFDPDKVYKGLENPTKL
ncbi:MAG: phosphoribosyl-AMP cyclohydrolase [Rickettsiales bacterium]|nr:phosphoribosyl-AMP cyclohydrolase [Rickettsiales bacterium]|tara:strand:+ start:1194 stop:1667 length:474 start_codon:yes stop_codon:yes gene_type:complete